MCKIANKNLRIQALTSMHNGLMTFGELEMARVTLKGSPVLYPEIAVRRYRSRVSFEFDLANYDSVEVHCKRGTESSFSILGETSDSHFIDIRPDQFTYTEIRHYKFYFSKRGIQSSEPVEIRIRTKGKFIFF